jgi:hypothetical protein
MCSIVFQTVPLCSHIQGFSFCSVPCSSVSFHRIAAIVAAIAMTANNTMLTLHSALTPR